MQAQSAALRVLFFVHGAQLGGAERSLIELVAELIGDYGVDCTLVVPGLGPLAAAVEGLGAATIIEPRLRARWATLEGPARVEGLIAPLIRGHDALSADLLPALEQLDPDIVFTQSMVIPWGAAAASLLGKPHIWSVCEYGERAGFSFVGGFDAILRDVRSSSSIILTATNALRNALFPDLGSDRARTLYRHIPLPRGTVAPNEAPFRVSGATRLALFGTLDPNKGQNDAIGAVAALVGRGHKVELLLAGQFGKPGYRAELDRQIAALGVGAQVAMPGFLPDPYPVMAAADIVLVCSRHEGFGRAAAEAMGLGRPVIYSAGTGVDEYMKDGVTGLSYRPGDPAQLADRIEARIRDPQRAAALGEAARRHVERLFTDVSYGGAVFELLTRLRDDPPSPVPMPRQLALALPTPRVAPAGSRAMPASVRHLTRRWTEWRSRAALAAIRGSALFDADFYRGTYADARAAERDPVRDYFWHGSAGARDPSPCFSSRAYLDAYPDVARAGMNPLAHYELFGRKEGRKPSPARAAAEANRYLPSALARLLLDGRDVSSQDIYLQPHSDDIAFSLGALARRRGRGILLTLFSLSRAVALPASPPASPEWVTATRRAEDRDFAAACGLGLRDLGIESTSLLGREPFDLAWAEENRRRIEAPLCEALLSAAATAGEGRARPWLFCPIGIGGHVDHVATFRAVKNNHRALAAHYRIGFYEDLHYAANPTARGAGVAQLRHEWHGGRLRRFVVPLEDGGAGKLALIRLYRSQFRVPPQAIERFTPAAEPARPPHEALWSEEAI